MLEPHRTMLRPGQGIVRPNGPTDQHSEYPKHMAHPAYQPGKAGDEVKSPHGFSYHVGGEAIRFPPVLAMDEDQEAYHASQGYVSIGKSDPAAFARAVRVAAPQAEEHVPAQYPKWIAALGRSVDSAEDEAIALGLTNEGAPRGVSAPELPPPPEQSEEMAALDKRIRAEDRQEEMTARRVIAAGSARMDALEQKVDTIVSSFDKLAGMLVQFIVGQAPSDASELDQAPQATAAAQQTAPAAKAVGKAPRSPESIARGEKIRAALAAKKAAAEAARRAAQPDATTAAQMRQEADDDC